MEKLKQRGGARKNAGRHYKFAGVKCRVVARRVPLPVYKSFVVEMDRLLNAEWQVYLTGQLITKAKETEAENAN
jgi:hypothetical protein